MMAWARHMWVQARAQPWLAAAVAALVASALLSAATGRMAVLALQGQQAEQADRAAEDCATAWATAAQMRNAVAVATRGGSRAATEALIRLRPDADPDDVSLLRALLTEVTNTEVRTARAEIADPECDLAAARARLDR